jgi:hypothetical protein
MKKWLVALLLVLAGVAAWFVFFIPVPAVVTSTVFVNGHQNAVYRCLTDKRLVQQWWPGSYERPAESQRSFVVAQQDYRFTITPSSFDMVRVSMDGNGKEVEGVIAILGLPHDSAAVTWKAEPQVQRGLFARVQHYFFARRLERDMTRLLMQLQGFTQTEKNIYGFAISREKVTDTLLVTTRQSSLAKPTVESYYALIQTLRDYIALQGVQEINYPMLNIRYADNKQYETMVAVPVSKVVPDQGAIVARRMVPGNILMAEVTGGPAAVDEGFRQLEMYMAENRLTSPGRPFQMLITDRLAERDTTKWITRLYYPVL